LSGIGIICKRGEEEMKKSIRGRELYNKYRLILSIFTKYYSLFPLKMRKNFLDRYRYTKGKIGDGIRYALLKSIAKECGDNVLISEGVYLHNPQNLIIGSNVSIHPMCYIECGGNPNNYIKIGNDVSIAHGSTIMATSHTYISKETNIIRDMKVISKPVEIGDNVWIGAKATILYGVSIGTGCVIGANSLVNKDTEKDAVYAGLPARKIKSRY